MKKLFVFMLLLGIASFGLAEGLVDVCFQSKWFPQAQFAGYFVAQEKGFYADEGLNVSILDGGNVNPTVQVASGNCDFGTDWIANMLIQREQGLKVTQIAQIFQVPGYRMVALSDSGIEGFDDLAGRKVGVWAFGNEFVAQAVFAAAGLSSNLDPTVTDPDVETVVYAFDPSLVFPNEVDVASAMIYNELDQIDVGLGYPLDSLNVLDPADIDAGLLEDLIFTTPELLAADDFKGSGKSGAEIAERFLRATIKGWQYAVDNQDEAVEIVIGKCGDTCNGAGSTQSPLSPSNMANGQNCRNGAAKPGHKIGFIDPDAFNQSVALLIDIGLIENSVNYDEIVDTSAYKAATE